MRVKRGLSSHKTHSKIRANTKGMTRAHRSSIKRGKQATTRSLQFAYRDRRNKKRTLRALWNARINAAARLHGTTYSRLMGAMAKSNVNLDRKTLAELSVSEPAAFESILKSVIK